MFDHRSQDERAQKTDLDLTTRPRDLATTPPDAAATLPLTCWNG